MQGDGLIEPYHDNDTVEALADARHHIDAGDFGQAQAIVNAALVRGGDQKDLLALLAWLRAEGGDRNGAASAFLRLSALIALDPEQDAFIGFDHLAEGRTVEAEPHLRKALTGKPEDAVVRTALAETLLQLDRPHAAIGVAAPSVRDGTATNGLWQTVVRATSLLDRPRLAEMLGRRAVRRHPDDIAPALAVARALLDGGGAERSLRLLAGLSDRDDPELWFLRSVSLAQLDRFGEAWSAIERTLAIAPIERAYLLHAIAVLGRLGRHADAAALLDSLDTPGINAVPSDGDTDEAWLRGVFATYTEAGRYDRAIAVGARIVRLLPDDLDFLSVYETVIGKHLYARLIASKPAPARAMERSARPATRGRIKTAKLFTQHLGAIPA